MELSKRLQRWVYALSTCVAVYMVSFFVPLPEAERVSLFLGLAIPIAVIRMVYVILRNERPSEWTFDSHFYEDGPSRL
ncbi:hypothetical protein [Phaeocystidibacter marisrubri]|uniref:Uncharacterized protein n=1 Tax=Phaeocystidibacter marisrubri TaxID=1577780 RepID=A0A6L3ZFE5_9FLAO|nr:hypothetical protein [Phaeocystidibacter marisrubri]KAB2816137.1 hypothetical protein F8C82_10640 [Phaeocystidibacter marisrubri]